MSESTVEIVETIVDVPVETGTMAVLRKQPARFSAPGVVMFHDGPGVRGATHDFALLLPATTSSFRISITDSVE